MGCSRGKQLFDLVRGSAGTGDRAIQLFLYSPMLELLQVCRAAERLLELDVREKVLETGTGQAGQITINSSLSYQHLPPVFHFLIMAFSSLPGGGLTHPDSSPAWLVFRQLLHYLCGPVLFWKSSRTHVRPVFGPGTLISLPGVNPCLPLNTYVYSAYKNTTEHTECRLDRA